MVTTVRVSEATRDRLRAVGLPAHQTADEVINAALDELERRRFWDQYAEAARNDDPTAEERAERDAWDGTLGDGLG
jgi:Arc/MetJ-type ribon-helix-helix transcriptional regulator